MSVEPTCDYCGVSDKNRCRSIKKAEGCSLATAEDIARARRGATPERHGGVNLTGHHRAAPAAPASKPTNPKDALAVSKLPLHLVPDTIEAYAALAFAEGASKYGAYNWRVAGVLASVYHSAMKRHLACWHNGEEADPVTGVPHLASVIACAGILLDAQLCGKLIDDRPPAAPVGERIRAAEAEVAKVLALFADRQPKHFTIADSAGADVDRS